MGMSITVGHEPQTPAEARAWIIERFGPYCYHGSAATAEQTAAWLAEGLVPQNGASFVWLGSRSVAGDYARERCQGRPSRRPLVFQVDLRLLDPELLRVDEQLGHYDHYAALETANPFDPALDEDEEDWRYRIYDLVSEAIEADPDFHSPVNIWRSYSLTGNLAFAGPVPAAALTLAD